MRGLRQCRGSSRRSGRHPHREGVGAVLGRVDDRKVQPIGVTLPRRRDLVCVAVSAAVRDGRAAGHRVQRQLSPFNLRGFAMRASSAIATPRPLVADPPRPMRRTHALVGHPQGARSGALRDSTKAGTAYGEWEGGHSAKEHLFRSADGGDRAWPRSVTPYGRGAARWRPQLDPRHLQRCDELRGRFILDLEQSSHDQHRAPAPAGQMKFVTSKVQAQERCRDRPSAKLFAKDAGSTENPAKGLAALGRAPHCRCGPHGCSGRNRRPTSDDNEWSVHSRSAHRASENAGYQSARR